MRLVLVFADRVYKLWCARHMSTESHSLVVSLVWKPVCDKALQNKVTSIPECASDILRNVQGS